MPRRSKPVMPSPSVWCFATKNSRLCGISTRRFPLSGPEYFTWNPVRCGITCSSLAKSGAG